MHHKFVLLHLEQGNLLLSSLHGQVVNLVQCEPAVFKAAPLYFCTANLKKKRKDNNACICGDFRLLLNRFCSCLKRKNKNYRGFPVLETIESGWHICRGAKIRERGEAEIMCNCEKRTKLNTL